MSRDKMTAGKLGYSIEEAAEQLGIGRSLMCELLARGAVRSVKIGKRRIVPADSLREYLAELTRQQAPLAGTG